MKTDKVSIIVPFYNAEMFIERCIISIIEQSYKNFELLLIDDGSTDKSYTICEKIKKGHSNIKLFKKKNGGPSSARNYGIDKATGKYIMFVDADDCISKDCLKKMIETVDDTSLIKVNYNIIKEHKNIINNKEISGLSNIEVIDNILSCHTQGFIAGTLFSKKTIGDLRFDESTFFLEDTLFLIQYLKRIKTVKIVDEVYFYFINKNSITASNEKILTNIISIDYSLKQIENELKTIDIKNVNDKINMKKIKLIEAELAKVKSSYELSIILNKKDFQDILAKINSPERFSQFYRIYFYLLRKKCKTFLIIYVKIRKVLKTIKSNL